MNLFTYSTKSLEDILNEYPKDFEWEGGVPITIKSPKTFREYEVNLKEPEYRVEWQPTEEIKNNYVLTYDDINYGHLVLPEDFITFLEQTDIESLKIALNRYKNNEISYRELLSKAKEILSYDTCELVSFVDEKLIKSDADAIINNYLQAIQKNLSKALNSLTSKEDKNKFIANIQSIINEFMK